MIFRENWGIGEFDRQVGGVPQGAMSVVESPDNRTGMMLLGQFLYEGLQNGEKCALVTFENPVAFCENFSLNKMNFYPFLDSEQLVYLQYKTSVTSEIGLSYRYNPIFEEIQFLAGEVPHRIAIHQVDALFSLHNVALMNACAQKLAAAAGQLSSTILGQFVQFNDDTHLHLSVACRKTMTGYFALDRGLTPGHYTLHTHRVPWYNYNENPISLVLREGEGFNAPTLQHETRKVG